MRKDECLCNLANQAQLEYSQQHGLRQLLQSSSVQTWDRWQFQPFHQYYRTGGPADLEAIFIIHPFFRSLMPWRTKCIMIIACHVSQTKEAYCSPLWNFAQHHPRTHQSSDLWIPESVLLQHYSPKHQWFPIFLFPRWPWRIGNTL